MARVLVTGATGFIGSRLTERLARRGDDVTCLVRSTSKRQALEALDVRLVFGDVRDPAAARSAVRGAEVVYHLAGLTSAFHARDLLAVNGEAFRNVAAACADQSQPPTVVLISSLAAAGPSPVDRPRTETDAAAPVSHYGKAKRAAELIAHEYAARVPISVLRPPIVFGQGDASMYNVFHSICRYGVHVALGVSASRFSLVHLDDLVHAMLVCAERGNRLSPGSENQGVGNGYYFVALDEQPTFAELGALIAASLGRAQVRIWRSSRPTWLWSAALAAEVFARLRGRPFIFNLDKAREALAGHWICSSQRIRRELGFSPELPLLERLRQTGNWYLQHGWL